MNYLQFTQRKSQDQAWPLKRADGSTWAQRPQPGYNPLGVRKAVGR